jgi:hypothetical protein
VPLPSGNSAESVWDLTTARQYFGDADKGGFRNLVIAQYPILVEAKCEQSLGRVWLEFLRFLQGSFRGITPNARHFATTEVNQCVCTRKSRPSHGEVGVELQRLFVKADGLLQRLNLIGAACFKSNAAQVCLVSLRIACRFSCQGLRLATG